MEVILAGLIAMFIWGLPLTEDPPNYSLITGNGCIIPNPERHSVLQVDERVMPGLRGAYAPDLTER